MNIFTSFFFTKFKQNILQNVPNCTIFKNFLGGACPRTLIPNEWLAMPRAAWSLAPFKYPDFSKNILNTPPPRNEILDTPQTLNMH